MTVDEDKFTKVPHLTLEALARFHLSGQQYQLVLAIIRKTYGWKGKVEDWISLSQFNLLTGITQKKVSKLLLELEARKIIKVTQKGDSKRKFYSINNRFDQWQKSPKKVKSSKKMTNIPQKGDEVSPIWGNTIDTITKDTIQKKNTSSPDGHGLASFFLFKKMQRDPDIVEPDMTEWTKDMVILLRIMEKEEQEIRSVIDWLFGPKGDYWIRKIESPGDLKIHYDQILADYQSSEGQIKPTAASPLPSPTETKTKPVRPEERKPKPKAAGEPKAEQQQGWIKCPVRVKNGAGRVNVTLDHCKKGCSKQLSESCPPFQGHLNSLSSISQKEANTDQPEKEDYSEEVRFYCPKAAGKQVPLSHCRLSCDPKIMHSCPEILRYLESMKNRERGAA
jgi:phage replication O-like protein O